jgi:hypothetical protein
MEAVLMMLPRRWTGITYQTHGNNKTPHYN